MGRWRRLVQAWVGLGPCDWPMKRLARKVEGGPWKKATRLCLVFTLHCSDFEAAQHMDGHRAKSVSGVRHAPQDPPVSSRPCPIGEKEANGWEEQQNPRAGLTPLRRHDRPLEDVR